MTYCNRRSFLRRTAAGLGSAWLLSQWPQAVAAAVRQLKIPLGFQTWTIRDTFVKDVPGTLKMLAAQGYSELEMCSPKGYATAGFGPLTSVKTTDLRSMIRDAGFDCPSSHFNYDEFTPAKLDESISFAQQLGLRHMICSGIFLPKTATMNDYLVAADGLNKAAEKIKEAGMQAGYHNHSFEFATLDGRLIYDALLERFHPGLVKMQFQTEVINRGFKAADYFNRFPGRFISAHLSDWTADKKEVPVGKGVIDWKALFAAAPTGGVQTFFVEMSPSTFAESAAYIQAL